MHPQDGAAVRPEDTGAKATDLGPGLSLLQQVGCWHLSLSSWVSNPVLPPSPFIYLYIYITTEGFWQRFATPAEVGVRWSHLTFEVQSNLRRKLDKPKNL